MKKSIIISGAMALLCSCAQVIEPLNPQQEEDNNVITLSVTATVDDGDAATRATLTDTRDILWSEGDEISLINRSGESYGEPLTLTDGAGTVCGTFTGEATYCEEGWFGVYPFDYDHVLAAPDTLQLSWYGNNQKAVKDGIDGSQLFMLGKAVCDDGAYSVRFRNLFAYFKFTVDFPCDMITISANAESTLACATLKVTLGDDGIPVITDHELNPQLSYDKDVHLRSGSTIEPGTYYLAVIPQTLTDGFEIEFEATSGIKYYKSSGKTVELKRNTILNLGEFDTSSFSTDGEFNGAGTESNPYQITSKAQLELLADRISKETDGSFASAHYIQTCDIDCGGAKLSPIGYKASSVPSKYFSGTYNGNGFKISNFVPGFMKSSGGIFGAVNNATIKNLTIEPKGYTKTLSGMQTVYQGMLVGYAMSDADKKVVIDNCKVTGGAKVVYNISGDLVTLGGIAALNVGNITITNCASSVNFTVDAELANTYEAVVIGGILGRSYPSVGDLDDTDTVIDRCRNTGNIWANGNSEVFAGGIVARLYEDGSARGDVALSLSNCVNNGNITAATNNNTLDAAAGGIVGSNRSDGYDDKDPHLYNCLNTGDIVSVGDIGYGGGIMGFVYSGDTKFYLCVSTGTVSNTTGQIAPEVLKKYESHLGAIAGDNYDHIFLNPGYYYWCYWTKDATMPIVYDRKDYSHASHCLFYSDIDSEYLNTRIRVEEGLPDKTTYAPWKGSAKGNDLDIDF